MNNKLFFYITSVIYFFLCTTYITYPLLFHPTSIATGMGDELLISWIQNYVLHALSTDLFKIFQANIFFPYHNALAFSETFITSSLISALPLFFIKEPIFAVNLTLFSSLFLLGLSSSMFVFSRTKRIFPSLLSGTLIIFSPSVLDKNVHLQVLSIYWVTFSIFSFVIFLETKKDRFLLISALCFIAQVYNSFLPAYFIIFANSIIFIYFVRTRKILNLFLHKKYVVLLLLVILLTVPLVIPYYNVSREFHFVRDIREAIHLGLQPEDLYYPNDLTKLQNFLLLFSRRSVYPENAEFKVGYLGGIFSILSILTIFYFVRNFKKNTYLLNALVTIAIVGIVLSFGPAMHLERKTIHNPFPIILPYALFYYLLPGFQGFRAAYRFEMLFVLAMALASCLFLEEKFKNHTTKFRNIFYLLLIIITIFEFNFPMRFQPTIQKKDFPKIYQYVNTLPENAVLVEMPIYVWYMSPYSSQELKRVYFSTLHFRKTVNGASGFSPPPWEKLARDLLYSFPEKHSFDLLRKMNVQYIIVHKEEYDVLFKNRYTIEDKLMPNGNEVLKKLRNNKDVVLVKKIDNDYLFKLLY